MNKAVVITIVVIVVLLIIGLIVGLAIYFTRKNKPVVAPTTIDLSKLTKFNSNKLVSVSGDEVKDSNTLKMNQYIFAGNPESEDFDKDKCGFRGLALLPSGLYLFKRKDLTSNESSVYGETEFSYTPTKALSSKAYLMMSNDGKIKLFDNDLKWSPTYDMVEGNTAPYTMIMSLDGAVRVKSSQGNEIFKSNTVVCTK